MTGYYPSFTGSGNLLGPRGGGGIREARVQDRYFDGLGSLETLNVPQDEAMRSFELRICSVWEQQTKPPSYPVQTTC